ncbi:stage II sporulation protein P [Clostridium formicaceticum]|uniref:Stage II sporulation protein P (SpoIIP) n=1 Tax=Clostridium formicaceticum TaxID=1497 RepID=A0AAC9WGN7_9CLOT|nr:stage II sporulation protein P [Clostridium formicaceticum]AOY77574.1 hypothetical protein BJL90_17965 [Clostridium formicaceticum]ARE88152.1 Stage II sporulation protein P (SpoIIP) [Clostridium formicaceticum]
MKKKASGLRDYQNIIILILILGILFFFGKMILDKNSFAEMSMPVKEEAKMEQEKNLPSQNKFLVHAIHQVFPISNTDEKISIRNYFEKVYSSFASNLFYVDFRNPVTFVQAQFPASLTQDIQLARENTETPGDATRDIFFVEEEDIGSIATGTLPEDIDGEHDKDDLGELWEGVYLVGEEDIVDSLDSSALSINAEKPAKIKFEEGKPHVLIYHTHGTESYKPASEGNYHTLRKEYSVIAIGEILTKELEKRGFNVIHDTTYHDYPSYSGSYSRSLQTAEKILKENPSIKVVFDIHRDGYDHIDTSPNREALIASNRAVVNNETTTKFQFVIGPETPNRTQVETFAAYIKAVSDSKYPDFSKPILVKPYGRFNQFLTDYTALIEVGSNANTIEEAKRAAGYLGNVLAEALEHIRE